jgi:hypothetical protein
MSNVGQCLPNKRLLALVMIGGLLLIFLAVIGFGIPNLAFRLIFIAWMLFLVLMAIASWYWWGRGIFKQKHP